MGPADTLRIEVAFSPAARSVELRWVDLPAGSVLADAVRACGLPKRCGAALQSLSYGIWGRARPLDTLLREGDRVEVLRGLEVDPKEARRLRYKRQRQRVAAAAGKTPL
ncbi:MAG: RnfH family protein [Burkholderiaceae bacterium]